MVPFYLKPDAISPEHIDALKKYADQMKLATQGLGDQATALQGYNTALTNAQQSAGAYSPMEIPQERKATSGEALGLVLADLGRELTSRVPANQRQPLPSGLQTFRQISQEDQDRALREASIKHQDAMDRLHAKAQADALALESAKTKYGFASDKALEARRVLEHTQAVMIQQDQFGKTFGLAQQSEINRANEFAQSFGLEKDKFDWEKIPQAVKDLDAASQLEKGLIANGTDKTVAHNAAFNKYIMDAANAEYGPKLLAQQYNLNEQNAKKLSEELKQLRTQGKYLEQGLLLDIAGKKLQNAHIGQEIENSRYALAQAKKSGDLLAVTAEESRIGENLRTRIALNSDLLKKTIDALNDKNNTDSTNRKAQQNDILKYNQAIQDDQIALFGLRTQSGRPPK